MPPIYKLNWRESKLTKLKAVIRSNNGFRYQNQNLTSKTNQQILFPCFYKPAILFVFSDTMDQQGSPIFIARRSLKRKLYLELQPQDQYEQQQSHGKVPILDPDGVYRDLPAQFAAHVRVLESTFSSS